jgi:pseudouridine kinase
MNIVILGATNQDITLHLKAPLRLKDKNPVDLSEAWGGVGFNLAYGLSKLDHAVHFCTALEEEHHRLEPFIPHVTALHVSPQPRYIGVMDHASVEVAFAAMAALDTLSLRPFEKILSALGPDDILLCDLNFPWPEVSALLKHTRARIFIEATSAPKIEKLKALNQPIEGLKLNRLEAEILTGHPDLKNIQAALETLPIQTLILTLGDQGVTVYQHQTWHHYQDTHPWQSVNESGVGDAFMVGYVSGLINHEDPVLNAFTLAYMTAQVDAATLPSLTREDLMKERRHHHVKVIA